MKKGMKQKGFTLIEIIVVVVILAILAALILPRFLNQGERAMIAEAQETLGALRRAQHMRIDLGQAAVAAAPMAAANWQALGLATPAGGARFNYGCDANSCTATRVGVAANTIQLYFNTVAGAANTADGSYVCAGAYQPIAGGANFNPNGCQIG